MKKFDVNLLRADLFRLCKQKSVWIALGIMAAVSLLLSIIFTVGIAGLSGLPSDVIGGSEAEKQAMVDSFNLLYKQLLFGFSDTAFTSTLLIIVLSLFVGSDFTFRRLSLLVSRGAERWQIYVSQFIVAMIVTFAYTAYSLLICGICFGMFGAGKIPFTAGDIGVLMRNFALQFLSNLSYASMTLMLAYLLRSTGAAMGSMFGITYGLSLIFSFVVMFASRNANTDWVMYMPLQQSDVSSMGANMSTIDICASTIMPVFYTALTSFIGAFTFCKRDLK